MNEANIRVVCLAAQRLQPGMRLAKSVLRADGVVLLKAGAELDETELSHMHQRGVEFAYVEVPETRDAVAVEAEVKAMQDRLEYIFRPTTEDTDARHELKLAVMAYRQAGTK
jgi:hypothetical protein